MNKRGSIADSITVPIYILIIAITIFIAFFVWTSFVTVMTPIADTVNLTSDGSRTLTDVMSEETVSIGYLDSMFPLLVVGLLLVSLIFAYKTGSSVVFAYISIFMWLLALILSVVLSNTFELFASNFPAVSTAFPIIIFVMANMKYICLGWAALISLVMFTRNKNDDQNFGAAEKAFLLNNGYG